MKVSIVDNQDMHLYMGDVNQYLKIEDCPLARQVQFFNPEGNRTVDVAIQDDGLCPIPNKYFSGSVDGVIKFYIYADKKTIGEGAFEVKPRQLSAGYIYEDTVIITYEEIVSEMEKFLAKTTTQAELAEGYASGAKESEENAKTSETNAEASAKRAEDAKANIETYETSAKASADRAEEAKANIETYEAKAKASADKAATSEANVSSMKASVDASKAEMEAEIEEAKEDIATAKTDAVDTIATDKADALSAIESAKTTAVSAVTAEKTTSVEAVQAQEANSKKVLQAYEASCKAYAESAEERAESLDIDNFYTKSEVNTKFSDAETKLTDNVSFSIDSEDARTFHLFIYGSEVADFTIPYNNAVKSVTFNESTKKLVFVFLKPDESEETAQVDLSALVDTYTAGQGLAVSDNEFSVKIKDGESVLKVDDGGLYTDAYTKSEVDTKLATKFNTSDYPFSYDLEGNLCYTYNENK